VIENEFAPIGNWKMSKPTNERHTGVIEAHAEVILVPTSQLPRRSLNPPCRCSARSQTILALAASSCRGMSSSALA